MGQRRGDEQQQEMEPPSYANDMEAQQQSVFGDMMQRQAQNRQAQLAMRMQRVQNMGGPEGFGGLLMGLGGAGGIESYLDQLLQKRMQNMGLLQQQPQQYGRFGPVMPSGMSPQQQAEWRDINSASLYQGS